MNLERASSYVAALFAACILDIQIQDRYFRLATEVPRVISLLAVGLAIAVALAISMARRRASLSLPTLLAVNWALCLWVALVLLPATGFPAGLGMVGQLVVLLVIGTSVGLAFRRPTLSAWERAGTALCAGSLLFVAAQPLLARALGSDEQWPPSPIPADAALGPRLVDKQGSGREATIFLLLDELSPDAVVGFGDDLRGAGFFVAGGRLRAESDATAKVIPAMWTGLGFERARPCSTTAICNDGRVLDFARVSVTRPDVDIVGFYHPYCAMSGLRSCHRIETSVDLIDPARWSCSVLRRLGRPVGDACHAARYAHWLEVRSGVLEALWQAPIWRLGGLLYAHVPLPHPPGGSDGHTLRQDYASNVLQARELVRQMAGRLRAGGFDRAQLVLFSDHPLRAHLWCSSASYAERDCMAENQVASDEVPVLIASAQPLEPALSSLRTNRDIFQLRATWTASWEPQRSGK